MQTMIDREEERTRLSEAADNPPQLVVLRGRRRVGKSFLVDRSLAGRRLVVQADEQPERGHLDVLAQEAGRLVARQPAGGLLRLGHSVRLLRRSGRARGAGRRP